MEKGEGKAEEKEEEGDQDNKKGKKKKAVDQMDKKNVRTEERVRPLKKREGQITHTSKLN